MGGRAVATGGFVGFFLVRSAVEPQVIQLLVQRAKQRLISGGHSRALVPAWQSLQRIGAAEVRRDAALRNK